MSHASHIRLDRRRWFDRVDQMIPDAMHLVRHKTFITVRDGTGPGQTYESRLLNQYDLAEYVEYAQPDEAMLSTERRTAYTRWLAGHINDEHSIIYHELCLLADAADAGLDITVTVHADSTHGPVILEAIRWMQRHTVPVDDGRRPRLPDAGSRPLLEMTFHLMDEEPELDPERMVWVLGKTVTHLGYLVDMEGVVTAAVPGYGLVKLGRFHAYRPSAWPAHVRPSALVPPGTWEDDVLAILAGLEADIDYPRYDPWATVPDPNNIGPLPARWVLFTHRPRPARAWTPDRVAAIRPVYRHNPRWRNPRPRVLEPEAQAAGQLRFYRPATPGEVAIHFAA